MTTATSHAATSGETIKSSANALYACDSAADNTRAHQQVVRRTTNVFVTDGGTAATVQLEETFITFPYAVKILSCELSVPVAVTADDTDYWIVTLASRTAAGVALHTLGTLQSTITAGTGDIVALATTPMTLSNIVVPAGDSLTVALTKSAGISSLGVIAAATAAAELTITYEES